MRRFALLLCVSIYISVSGPALAAPAPSFDEIVAPNTRSHEASRALMRAWVDAHPQDPQAPRGLLWMAQLYVADHQRAQAGPLFARVIQQYPGTEWAEHSLKGLADIDMDGFRYGAAIAKYDTLARSSAPFFRYVGGMSAIRAREARLRFWITLVLLGALVAMWALRLRRLPSLRSLWPPPVEVVYPLPILVLMAIAAIGPPEGEGHGAILLALGAVVLLWLNGAYLRARPAQGLWQVVHGVLGVGQAAALLYIAVILTGLWGKFHDTLEMGAD